MLVSLAVHLSPLLLLLSWASAPAEVVTPIPIELVLEQPPPPPEPKPEQKAEKPPPPPPLGRLASADMGEPVAIRTSRSRLCRGKPNSWSSTLAVYRAGNRCVTFDYLQQQARNDAEEAIAIEEPVGFHTPYRVRARRSDRASLRFFSSTVQARRWTCSRSSSRALRAADANGDPIRPFAMLELGELQGARDVVRRLAVRALARRYAYEANDSVVMLAGLALAEGDTATATQLVLMSGTGSGWAVIVADNLAMPLERPNNADGGSSTPSDRATPPTTPSKRNRTAPRARSEGLAASRAPWLKRFSKVLTTSTDNGRPRKGCCWASTPAPEIDAPGVSRNAGYAPGFEPWASIGRCVGCVYDAEDEVRVQRRRQHRVSGLG